MSKPRVIVCTEYSPAYQELADIAIPNMREYCGRHGYEMRIIGIDDNDFAFRKHEALKEMMEADEADLFWYRDVDGLIMRMDKKIEDYVAGGYAIYLTKDANEINGGSIIVPNTKVGRIFNDIVLENKDMFPNEQNFYNSMPNLMMGIDYMKLLPQGTINAYDYSLYEHHKEYMDNPDMGDYSTGSLFIHFPGIAIPHRKEMMKEYLNKVIK